MTSKRPPDAGRPAPEAGGSEPWWGVAVALLSSGRWPGLSSLALLKAGSLT